MPLAKSFDFSCNKFLSFSGPYNYFVLIFTEIAVFDVCIFTCTLHMYVSQ